jgi:hypothetical protein
MGATYSCRTRADQCMDRCEHTRVGRQTHEDVAVNHDPQVSFDCMLFVPKNRQLGPCALREDRRTLATSETV